MELSATMLAFQQALEKVGLPCVVNDKHKFTTAYQPGDYFIKLQIRETPDDGMVRIFGYYNFKLDPDTATHTMKVCQLNRMFSDAIFVVSLTKGDLEYRLDIPCMGNHLTVDDCARALHVANGVLERAHDVLMTLE